MSAAVIIIHLFFFLWPSLSHRQARLSGDLPAYTHIHTQNAKPEPHCSPNAGVISRHETFVPFTDIKRKLPFPDHLTHPKRRSPPGLRPLPVTYVPALLRALTQT